MERRVVITGLGAITSIGNSVEEVWEGIENKRCGLNKITAFETDTFKTKLAAEVKNYDPANYLEPKQARKLDRVSQFAF